MTLRHPGRLHLVALLVGVIALPLAALEVSRFTVDGGGGTSTGGAMTVAGTIGQPDAGRLQGDALTLTGGFWLATDDVVSAPESAPSPAAYRLHRAAPNPFNPTTKVSFDLPVDSRAVLRVFDMSGRMVRVLADEVLASGTHQLAWDGRNQYGAKVASGIYVLQMRAGNFAATQKLTLLK